MVVDPKRTKIAEKADLHLALRPGTDVVLAWALTAELERLGAFDRAFIEQHVEGFESYMARARQFTLADAERISGVPEAEIQQLADWYHQLSPAAISVGNGLERNQNGGSGIRAIFALPALAGKFGAPGGGLVNGASLAFPKTPARLQRPDLVPAGTRTLNIVDIGRPSPGPRAGAADQGAVHLQPQPGDRAPGPEPAAAGARPRGSVRRSGRTS